jgi:hypothetical protein
LLGQVGLILTLSYLVPELSNLGSKIVEISIRYGEDQEEEKQHKSFKSTTQMERLAKRMMCGRHVKSMCGYVKGGGWSLLRCNNVALLK